jgi:hypothetical protein
MKLSRLKKFFLLREQFYFVTGRKFFPTQRTILFCNREKIFSHSEQFYFVTEKKVFVPVQVYKKAVSAMAVELKCERDETAHVLKKEIYVRGNHVL